MSSVSIGTPFLGLRFFDESQAHLFFGRDEQVDDLLDRLNSARCVAVIGPSGCGKSSLVRAGLIPALHSVATWRIVALRPRDNPIRELAASLGKTFDASVSGLELTLRRGILGLLDATREAGLAAGENLLIVIDQFEELFRYGHQAHYADEAASFVRLLLEASGRRDSRIHVLVTMRSDYLGNCEQFRDLPERLNDGLYLVPRMRRDQLERAIVGPVHAAGAQIAPRLVQRLLNDVGDDPDQLPVLQHALLRTWIRWRDAGMLGALDLQHSTGLQNTLDEQGEEIYDQLPERLRETAETIFRCLTEVDESREIRRPAELSALAAVADTSVADVRAVVDAFRADGVSFLNPEPDRSLTEGTIVDITHESLIRRWKRLREWALQEAADRDVYLEADKRAGQAKGEDDYLKGVDLERAGRWLERQPSAAWAQRYGGDYARTVAFIRQSQEERNREAADRLRAIEAAKRRAFALAGVSSAVTLVIALLGVLFWNQRRDAEAATRAAETALVGERVARQQASLAWQSTLEMNSLLTSTIEEEKAARTEAERQRLGAIWQSLTRESVRESASRLDDDRAALLARQAMIIHARTSNEPDLAIEDALQQAARLDPFVHNILAGHVGPVYGVSFSPDGIHLSSAGDDGTVRVWDLQNTGTPSVVLSGHQGPVRSVDFSADGRRLASAGADSIVRVWNLREASAAPVAFSGHQSVVRTIDFSTDGARLASGSDDGTVRVWDVRTTRAEPVVLRGHENGVWSVAFSPEGGRLASAGADRIVRVWDLRNPGAQPLLLSGHRDAVRSVAFSRDGTRLVSGGDDGTFRVWDLAKSRGSDSAVFQGQQTGGVLSVSFSPDGGRLATAGADRAVRVWDLRNPGTQPMLLPGHESGVLSVAFSPDGARLASGSLDGTARVWDANGSAQPSVIQINQGAVRAAAFSPDGKRLISGGADRNVRLWELGSVYRQSVLEGNGGSVWAVAFSHDGSRAAAAGDDSTVRVWDVRKSGGQPVLFKGHAGIVRSLAFSRDGAQLASAGDDSAVHIWDLRNANASARRLQGHRGPVNVVTFSPDGSRLVSAGEDGTVRVWQVRDSSGDPLSLRGGSGRSVLSVAFSPDGKLLASGGVDRALRIWDLEKPNAPPVVLQGHESGVRSVAFSPDGARLASGGDDNIVRIWNVRKFNAQPVLLRRHENSVSSVAFSPDNTRLVSASADSSVRLWRLGVTAADFLCTRVWRNLSINEWQSYIGESLPYERTCPALPPGAGVVGTGK